MFSPGSFSTSSPFWWNTITQSYITLFPSQNLEKRKSPIARGPVARLFFALKHIVLGGFTCNWWRFFSQEEGEDAAAKREAAAKEEVRLHRNWNTKSPVSYVQFFFNALLRKTGQALLDMDLSRLFFSPPEFFFGQNIVFCAFAPWFSSSRRYPSSRQNLLRNFDSSVSAVLAFLARFFNRRRC